MTMLTDFNATLKQLLVKRVPLDPNEVEISFDCPKREWSAKVIKPTMNLYLFDVRENVSLRTRNYRTVNGPEGRTGRLRPPVYVDLSYFVTSWAREISDEHTLLWRAMTAMMRESELGKDLLQGTMKEDWPVNIMVAQADGVLRNPGEFWNALDNDLKPAVVYSVTLPVDLNVMREAPLVLTAITDIMDARKQRVSHSLAVGGIVHAKAKGKGRGAPISDVGVSFPDLGISVRTGDDGRYVASGVPEGTHQVRVTQSGAAVLERELVIPSRNYDLEV
ncbi:MAG TPA: Pvc16 family protein [Chloroflexota bacterium]|nr:Pvc16 family protein [Chloroflexota bacterium]